MLINLEGAEPHEEDTWIGKRIGLGDAVLRVLKPDARCAITTHDPNTGRAISTRSGRSSRTAACARASTPTSGCWPTWSSPAGSARRCGDGARLEARYPAEAPAAPDHVEPRDHRDPASGAQRIAPSTPKRIRQAECRAGRRRAGLYTTMTIATAMSARRDRRDRAPTPSAMPATNASMRDRSPPERAPHRAEQARASEKADRPGRCAAEIDRLVRPALASVVTLPGGPAATAAARPRTRRATRPDRDEAPAGRIRPPVR